MGKIRQALQDQVQYGNLQKFYGTSATILYYDKTYNTATISFIDPNSGEAIYRKNVPLCITMGGLTGGCIMPGQQCAITFVNNNIYCPVITGITESLYSQKTSDDQGAYIVDSFISSCKKPEDIQPMSDDWMDYGNDDIIKYDNNLCQFDKLNPDTVVQDVIYTLNKYKDTEQGMTNPFNKSTVKIKENGDIDIFGSNNTGIRVSPESRCIDIYGNVNLNGESLNDFKQKMNVATIVKIVKIESLINQINDLNDLSEYQIKSFKSLKDKYYSEEILVEELDNIYSQLLSLTKICS